MKTKKSGTRGFPNGAGGGYPKPPVKK